MKIQLGIAVCLLAGCATQPTTTTVAAAAHAEATATPARFAPATDFVPRIGLEYLPPDDRLPEREQVLVESPHSTAGERVPTRRERALRTVALDTPEPSRTPDLAEIDFDEIRDPVARETLHFCSDLITSDRQRVRREVGIPFFDFRYEDPGRGPLLTSERRLREDHEQWSQEHGVRLLNRPLKRLGRRLPIVQYFELALRDFRSDHVPLSEPYRKAHGDRRKLGRLSLRLHVRDPQDPAEVVYIHPSGVRVGTSQQRAKLALDLALLDSVRVSLRARNDYDSGKVSLRSDLIYRPSPSMSVHLAAGDDMDFLTTSSLYSLFESPMDGRPGLLLYAVHTF